MRPNPIADREAREMWRDYRMMLKEGNPLGLSFVEYVAHRVFSSGTRFVYMGETTSGQAPWYVATCGHQHPWGQSCSSWTAT